MKKKEILASHSLPELRIARPFFGAIERQGLMRQGGPGRFLRIPALLVLSRKSTIHNSRFVLPNASFQCNLKSRVGGIWIAPARVCLFSCSDDTTKPTESGLVLAKPRVPEA